MKKQAYAPALAAVKSARIQKLRELPLPGRNLVEVGQHVCAEQAVLTAELPGDLSIIRVADRMGLEPFEVVSGMKIAVGDSVEKGQLLCEVEKLFGFFKARLESPVSGVVEFFTPVNAHLALRHPPEMLELNAYIDGRVIAVEQGKSVTIETDAAFVQGIFGVGGEQLGSIFVVPDLSPAAVVDNQIIKAIADDLRGKIVVGGGSYTIEALQLVAERGAVGVICGSIDSLTLAEYVGRDIGVSITGDEEVPCTLIITEGFGRLPISVRVLEILSGANGKRASINGATQVRAGATRPEIVIPESSEVGTDDNPGAATDENQQLEARALVVGARARIIRVPYFGEFGTITELPTEPEKIESGAIVRVLRAELENGTQVTVPRANVELV